MCHACVQIVHYLHKDENIEHPKKVGGHIIQICKQNQTRLPRKEKYCTLGLFNHSI